MLIITLFIVGMIFFAAELFVPGGLLGGLGGLCLLLSSLITGIEFGATAGLIALVASLLAMGFVFFLEIKLLPNTRFGRRFFLSKAITEISSSQGEKLPSLIGETASALTTLSPSGYVRIQGKRYEAVSQSGFISPGTSLLVVDTTPFQVTVKAMKAGDAS